MSDKATRPSNFGMDRNQDEHFLFFSFLLFPSALFFSIASDFRILGYQEYSPVSIGLHSETHLSMSRMALQGPLFSLMLLL